MFSILSAIPLIGKFFEFGNNVTNAIRDLQLSKIKAQTDKEKAQIQERIDQLQAIAAVQSIEAKESKINAIARFTLFGLPAGVAIWKLVVWDKVIGSYTGCAGKFAELHLDQCKTFRTDNFDPNMWWVILAAAGFYLITNKR